ncbi:hypothetical protein EVAR_45953_1 [Eumeta japonica]|uniref:Uncharacterized protein n=1 Tax=Eumeta variegata TaxID=151549 RepID=A0A4C1YRS5_EUMVA|nr:hypothetical protein EVAR_45953_1 [Eumeta japonica]
MGEPSDGRWSPPPADTRNPRGVTRALPATWDGLGHLMKGDWLEGRGRRQSGPPQLLLAGRHSNFLKLISKRYTRSKLVNCANGPLLQHENSINIRGVFPEEDAIQHQTMETAKINQSGSLDV